MQLILLQLLKKRKEQIWEKKIQVKSLHLINVKDVKCAHISIEVNDYGRKSGSKSRF